MATQAATTQVATAEQYTVLHKLIHTWDRRWRWQQVISFLPYSLIPGIVLGIVLTLISRARPWLLKNDILIITLAALLMGLLVLLLLVWLWRRPILTSARRFDRLFGLQERLSTALELIEGRIHTNDDLIQHQLNDTLTNARAVTYQQHIRFRWPWRAWGGLAVLVIVLAILLLLPNPQVEAIQQANAQEALIEEAIEDIKEITEQVATDAALESQERQQLLETLQTNLETLEENDITPEEAFATLKDMETFLRDQSQEMETQLEMQEAALEGAMETLETVPSEGGSEEDAGEGANTGATDLSEMLDQVGQGLNDSSSSEYSDLADALDQAADQLDETNPEAAESIREAGDALRENNPNAAREALEQASEQLSQDSQSSEDRMESSQGMQEAADQMKQTAQQLAQMNPNSQSQPQPGQGSKEGQAGETGEQSGEEGSQPAESGGSPNPVVQPGQGEESTSSTQMNIGGTGGSGDESNLNMQPSGGSSSNIDQNNNPDGKGEGEYEPVYAPQRIGGESTDTSTLEIDDEDMITREGEFQDNPAGDVTVPYNEVFSDYQDAVNAALDSDYIPLGLRDVVHDYFTSLEPER